MNSPHRRLRQLQRVLTVIECLAPLRSGATLPDITADVSELVGESYCERTIRRDLDALEQLGIVEPVSQGHAKYPLWRFVDRSIRSRLFSRLAELRSDARDPMATAG